MTGARLPRIGEGRAVRAALIAIVLTLSALVIAAPLVAIFAQAFSRGVDVYFRNLDHPDMRHAIRLTLVTAAIAVPINTLFGFAAAWAVAKFDFPGRNALLVLIEIPFSISPVVAGVSLLFVYGLQGLFGPLLDAAGLKVMFAVPGIIMASLLVTAPFVARELIPLMQAQGPELEETAVSFGASGLRTIMRVTLPNVRWALLYGIVLCNARVMGEFGAVSVVSGNIRGQTNTLPLHVELLYHDYNAVGAFAAASLLTLVALLTLLAKMILEQRIPGERKAASIAPATLPEP